MTMPPVPGSAFIVIEPELVLRGLKTILDRPASIEDKRRAIAILYIGGVDDDIQQEAERIDENMPLAARDLLARTCGSSVEPPFERPWRSGCR
jgi:hypothetical protein